MAARAFIDAYSAEAVGEIKGLIPALLDQIFKLMAEVHCDARVSVTACTLRAPLISHAAPACCTVCAALRREALYQATAVTCKPPSRLLR